MTIVVLLFLAVIWAAVLLPPAIRARAEGRPADSIGSFRRQLHVLERTGPATVAPAHRLFHGGRPTGPAAIGAGLGYPIAPAAMARPTRAAMARKRRREVFQVLLASMAGSLVLGFLPPLRVMWGMHLVLDILFVAYVALLLRMRNMAAERDLKVRFLPAQSRATPEPAFALRRSAN